MRRRRSNLATYFAICIMLFVTILIGISANPTKVAATHYDCNSGLGCAGSIRWNGGMDGAQSSIWVGQMSMSGTSSNNHINNALWVSDRVVGPSDDCSYLGAGTGSAWVEVGYQSEGGNQWPQYFYWVDCRIDSQYYEEPIGVVNSVDWYDYNQFRIIRNGYQSPYWDVTIDSVCCTDYRRVTAYNPMTADSIEIGGEVTGRHGGFSDYAYFQTNEYIWITPSGGLELLSTDCVPK